MATYNKPEILVSEDSFEGVFAASGAACYNVVVESERTSPNFKSITLAISHVDNSHEQQDFTCEVFLSSSLPADITVGGSISHNPNFSVSGNKITFDGAPNRSNPEYPSWHLIELSGTGAENIKVVSGTAWCK